MTHRTARERLFFEAKDLPRDVLELPGIRGHRAVLEPSAEGPARMIHVFDGDVEVGWMLVLEAGEARPPFYPPDVPYVATLSAALSWDDEVGLHVRWTPPANKARIAEMVQGVKEAGLAQAPKGLTELAKRLREAPAGDRRRVLESLEDDTEPVAAWAKTVFGDPASGAHLPDDASAALDQIRSFHEENGWEVLDPGSGEGPSRRVRLGRGAEVRELYAVSVVGITMVGLSEVREPDAASRSTVPPPS